MGKSFQIVIASGMHKGVIENLAKSNDLKLREGAVAFFNILAKHKIPLLIFSAGIGNVIEEFLKSRELNASWRQPCKLRDE